MRRKAGILFWVVVAIALVAILLVWQYLGYRSSLRYLPESMTMAGLSMGGMTRDQAINALEVAYATPLEVRYQEHLFSLAPESVGLAFDPSATRGNLDEHLEQRASLDGFFTYVLRRTPEPVTVPVVVDYSLEKVEGFLTLVASQYDREPQAPVPLPENLTFSSGHPGYGLDREASRSLLVAALLSAVDQSCELVVRTEPVPPIEPAALEEMLQRLLDAQVGLTAGVFVKSLDTGDEVHVYADVAYTGLSVLKLAVMEETYRVLDPPLAPDVSEWLSASIGLPNSNSAANQLLIQVLGEGDAQRGMAAFIDSMNYLGLENTFIAAPYDEPSVSFNVATPANSRPQVPADPEPHMQTTPLDMGLLLEMIYECSQGGGTLRVAYPGAFDVEECGQMLNWMRLNQSPDTESLIEAGVPPETDVLHKQGFTSNTHADAGIVFSDGGDYVLVIYLHRNPQLDYETSASLMADVATATHNYFNPGR